MAERGFAPDQAIASDARRTTQTLTAVLREFTSPPRPTLDHDLYLAAPSVLLSAIRAAPKDAKALLLVGHNPGIAELALTLAGAGDAAARRRLEEGFPTAALAVLDFDAPAWTDVRARAGSLRAFETGRP
jgi:phosphohistidine phosphatase